MAKETYRIDIEIDTKENYKSGIDKAKKDVEVLEKTAKKTSKSVEDLGSSSKKAADDVEKVGTSARRSDRHTSRFQKTLSKTERFISRVTGGRHELILRARDHASRVIRGVSRFASRNIERTYRTTLRAINMGAGVIRGFSRALLSLPAMITVGLGVVGVGSLGKATIGSSMNFEDYGVSMDHWLKDDKKTSKELMDWMGQKADLTPYTSADIFPAMTGAIGMVGNNENQIKRLTSTAIDMAALTPGSSVEDAMQAIQNAQMGEMTMMKRFGFNINKADYDSMGFDGFIDEIEKRFEGGALRLSETGRGQLNTLKGYMQSQFRSMGDGILDGMKPRLQGVTKWLMDNEDAWGKWKKTVENAGRQASEWVFSGLETGFKHIRDNYLENKEFHDLDFEGKIKFIMDDIGSWWSSHGGPAVSSWWDGTGKPMAQKLGTSIGKAMVTGIAEGVKQGVSMGMNMWGDTLDTAKEHGVFSKETGSSLLGAAGGTALLAGGASLLLHPLTRMMSGTLRGGKKAFGGLEKGAQWIGSKMPGKGKLVPTQEGLPPPTNGRSQRHMPKADRWWSKVKTPKGIMNRIPFIGPALGALSLLGTKKDDMYEAVGGIGGGALGGAVGGAAVGSVVPVVGTAIGGILGGLLGATGGAKLGRWAKDNKEDVKESGFRSLTSLIPGGAPVGMLAELTLDKAGGLDGITDMFEKAKREAIGIWDDASSQFQTNVWEPIKVGAAEAGEWVGDKFTEAKTWVSDSWSSFSGWFSEAVWTPFSNAAIDTTNFFVGLFDISREMISETWSSFSGWFSETVWEPVKEGAAATGEWISDKYSEAKEWVSETWATASEWFEESVWIPIKEGAMQSGEWISTKYSESKELISETWSTFSSWFSETVWEPVKEGALTSGQWLRDQYTQAKDFTQETWSTFSSWFVESVWEPVKEGATATGEWISTKYQESKDVIGEAWSSVSGWFEETVWAPIKSGAETAAGLIAESFNSAKESVTSAYDWAQGKWDAVKEWGGKIRDRGRSITGYEPSYAKGTNFHPGGPAIVGDGGGSELVQFPDGRLWLSPSTDTRVNLPRGTKVLPHNQTKKLVDVPHYAEGVGNFGNIGSTIVQGDTNNSIGDINVTVVVEGDNSVDPQSIGQQVANEVAGILADKIESIGPNVPVSEV